MATSSNTHFDENKYKALSQSDIRAQKAIEYFHTEPYHLRAIREQKERERNAKITKG